MNKVKVLFPRVLISALGALVMLFVAVDAAHAASVVFNKTQYTEGEKAFYTIYGPANSDYCIDEVVLNSCDDIVDTLDSAGEAEGGTAPLTPGTRKFVVTFFDPLTKLRVGSVTSPTYTTVKAASSSNSGPATSKPPASSASAAGSGGLPPGCPPATLKQVGGANGAYSGDVVKCVKFLLEEGYPAIADEYGVNASSSSWGQEDANAIYALQDSQGLGCKDGIVGAETWNKLLGESKYTTSAKCTSAASNDGSGDKDDPKKTPDSTAASGAGLECEKLGLKEKNGLCLPDNPNEGKGGIISCDSVGGCLTRIIRILLTLAGIIAVLFIILGGFKYMTSNGDEKKAEGGRKTLTNALIGLGAILLAYTLVTIIYNTLTKDSIF